jgi:hypothetical protein
MRRTRHRAGPNVIIDIADSPAAMVDVDQAPFATAFVAVRLGAFGRVDDARFAFAV